VQAKAALLAAVARQPQHAEHRFNLGVVLERMGDREGAARAFVETLRLKPDHAQA
jgi:Flp pilus assembly protein TadD